MKNKGSKVKAKVSGKKHCSSNSEYIDDDDEALRQVVLMFRSCCFCLLIAIHPNHFSKLLI